MAKDGMALGVSLGFVCGAIFGIVAGLMTDDIAVWLTVGIGCGIALGAQIGWMSGKSRRTKKLDRKKGLGYAIFAMGFVMLLVNAIGYVFGLGLERPALTIFGLVFVAMGMNFTRKRN